jgi:hypothetical protein
MTALLSHYGDGTYVDPPMKGSERRNKNQPTKTDVNLREMREEIKSGQAEMRSTYKKGAV